MQLVEDVPVQRAHCVHQLGGKGSNQQGRPGSKGAMGVLSTPQPPLLQEPQYGASQMMAQILCRVHSLGMESQKTNQACVLNLELLRLLGKSPLSLGFVSTLLFPLMGKQLLGAEVGQRPWGLALSGSCRWSLPDIVCHRLY